MQHSFDIIIAEKFGVNVAIFLNNIAFWVKKNQANNKHFYEGRHWTYNSQEALTQLFPYWSRQNIRTILKDCLSQGLLLRGNFNETGYDRTTWYALTDLGLSLFSCFNNTQQSIGEIQPIDLVKPTESLVESNQPIPDSKPDIKPNRESPKPKPRQNRAALSESFVFNDEVKQLAEEVGQRVGLTGTQLREKFILICRESGKTSADWNASAKKFLLSERVVLKQPVNVSEKAITPGGAAYKFFEDAAHPSNHLLSRRNISH